MASNEERSWVGDNAIDEELDHVRRWVVWGGGGSVPEELAFAGSGNDIAEMIARGVDQKWASRDDRWVIVVRAGEDDIDSLKRENPRVMGYAPYLMEGSDVEAADGPMEPTLRSDVAPRRKVEPR